MSKVKSIFRELRQAILDGMAHSKDKLHQFAQNIDDHLADIVTRVRGNDRFDAPDRPGGGGSPSTGTELVPRPETLGPDGRVDWSPAPHDGFVLDADGNPIKYDHVPNAGDRFDRYGDPNGRFVSPIPEDGPFSYESRSVPYYENPRAYHQYEWLHSPADVQKVYDQLSPADRADVDAVLDLYDLDVNDLARVVRGEAASIPEWGTPGGATQDHLPVSVSVLDSMGMIREVG